MYVGIQPLDSTSNREAETHWSTVSGISMGFCVPLPYLLWILPKLFQVQISFWIQTHSLTSAQQYLGDLRFSQFQVSLHGVIHHQLLSSINNHQLPVCHGHLSAHLSHSQHHLIPLKPVALQSLLLGHLVPRINLALLSWLQNHVILLPLTSLLNHPSKMHNPSVLPLEINL